MFKIIYLYEVFQFSFHINSIKKFEKVQRDSIKINTPNITMSFQALLEVSKKFHEEEAAAIAAANADKRIKQLQSIIYALEAQKAYILESNVIFREKIQTQVMPAMKATEFRLKLALEENEILKRKIQILEQNQIPTLMIDEWIYKKIFLFLIAKKVF